MCTAGLLHHAAKTALYESTFGSLLELGSRFYLENKLNSKFLEGALGSENWKQLGAGKLLVNGCEAAVLPVASLRAPLQAF